MTTYRAWLSLSEPIPVEDEHRWEPLIAALERDHAALGPVIGWDDGHLRVVVSGDVADESDLARLATDAVTDALHHAGLHHLYPSSIEIEPADNEPAVAVA